VNPHHRFIAHLCDGKLRGHDHKSRWIKQTLRQDLKPTLQILEEGVGDHWQLRERFWIAAMRALGHPLTNMTPRGNGGATPSDVTRRKLSEALKGLKKSPAAIAKRLAP
jgi:hypothetical protein